MKKIILVCGGPSSEYDVSINSAKSIYKALDKKKYEISILHLDRKINGLVFKPENEFDIPDKKGLYSPIVEVLREVDKTSIFVLCAMHGEFGEDGRLQSILDHFGLKYTGSGMSASALCMDKFRSALIVEILDEVALPKTTIIDLERNFKLDNLEFPLIYKPNNLGSTVGLYIVENKKELDDLIKKSKKEKKYRYALLQEYIQGALELTCGCLENNNGDYTLIPPVEIIPKKAAHFDYASKYEDGGAIELSPPESISKKLADNISQLACKIHSLLGCKTYSRSDFLMKDDVLYYIETNNLPGMTKNSLIPKEAKAAGIDFSKLLDFIIDNA